MARRRPGVREAPEASLRAWERRLAFFCLRRSIPILRGVPCPQPFSCPVPAGAPGASRCPFSSSSSSVPAKRPPRKRSKSCPCRSSAAACGGCCPATSWSWRWRNGDLPLDFPAYFGPCWRSQLHEAYPSPLPLLPRHGEKSGFS